MTVSLLVRIGCGALAVCSVSCAGRFDPANFQGSREPRRVEPEAIRDAAARTSAMESLGTVHASCRVRAGFRRLKGERLSDLDCSNERLLFALRESAASAGGELLIGPECNVLPGTDSPDTQQRVCAAYVARYVSGQASNGERPLDVPRSPAPGSPAPSASDVKRIDEPDASLAFRVSLDFEPLDPSFEHPALLRDQVRELPSIPLADHALGDLTARCEQSCDERSLRYGVLIAAGRLGVPDVVGVRCFSSGAGNACVGTLAAPERSE